MANPDLDTSQDSIIIGDALLCDADDAAKFADNLLDISFQSTDSDERSLLDREVSKIPEFNSDFLDFSLQPTREAVLADQSNAHQQAWMEFPMAQGATNASGNAATAAPREPASKCPKMDGPNAQITPGITQQPDGTLIVNLSGAKVVPPMGYAAHNVPQEPLATVTSVSSQTTSTRTQGHPAISFVDVTPISSTSQNGAQANGNNNGAAIHQGEGSGASQRYHPTTQYSFRNPLQATDAWATQQRCQVMQPHTVQQQQVQQQLPVSQPPVPFASFNPPRGQQNLAPPQVPQQQPGHPYTTMVDVSPITTPSGHRQIQGLLHNPYNQYIVNATGPGGMPEHNPYSEYSHLDLADYLPSATIAAIRSRSYIDFAKLLPDNVDDPLAENKQANFAEIGGMKLSVTTKKGKAKEIDGIIKWVRAFAVWAFVYLDTNPHEGKGLFQYLHQILDGDRRFVWSVVYRYDKEVRLSMEKDPYR